MEEIRPCSFPDWEKHCADKLDAERSAIIASGEINSVLSWFIGRGDFQKQSHFPSKRPTPKEFSFQLAIVINNIKYFTYLPNPSLYRLTMELLFHFFTSGQVYCYYSGSHLMWSLLILSLNWCYQIDPY